MKSQKFKKEVRAVSFLRLMRKLYQFFVDIPVEEGAIINHRYKVIKVIGTGSYGIVYLCKDLKTREERVVKQLRPSKRRNKKEQELFRNEIEVLRNLSHPSTPILYESFASEGNFFYVMGFIKGDNLEDLIFVHKKTFNEEESLRMLTQLLEIIDNLHSKGIYHQDLRIPNIIMNNKKAFLIDFGLAKRVLNEANPQKIQELKLQDYYDLGEILLYLLYTTYSSQKKKVLPWTEELSLENETVFLLKRLLGIKEPYSSSSEISTDLQTARKAANKGMTQVKEV